MHGAHPLIRFISLWLNMLSDIKAGITELKILQRKVMVITPNILAPVPRMTEVEPYHGIFHDC